jgi:hypothetical protein
MQLLLALVVHLEHQLAALVLVLRLVLFHQQRVVVVVALNKVALQQQVVQAVVVVVLQTLQALLELLGKEMLAAMVKHRVSRIVLVVVVERVQ